MLISLMAGLVGKSLHAGWYFSLRRPTILGYCETAPRIFIIVCNFRCNFSCKAICQASCYPRLWLMEGQSRYIMQTGLAKAMMVLCFTAPFEVLSERSI